MESDSRFKFVDDLTMLERINLLLGGMASHNNKNQVANDIPISNKIMPPVHLKSQHYLNDIKRWKEENKMELNEEKTKCMAFNFTNKNQFSTRISLNGKNSNSWEQ